jgi:type VI protein secretion system component VasF
MTSITTTVRTHRSGLAVVGALAALVLAAVALLLFTISQAHDMHHLVTSYQHLPQFVRSLLGAGRLGS